MKFFAATALFASIATVLGQSVVINPVNGLVAHPNTPFTFELDRPVRSSSKFNIKCLTDLISLDFPVLLSGRCRCCRLPILPTPEGCANGFFGDVLYNGVYRPVNDPNPQKHQNQNITVMIPDSPTGFGRLTVTHFALVGASLITTWADTSNVTLSIV
ncbi:hypothetical protein BDQ17DRAFT_1346968 [Cyathus striatus]|nr:hypothetical protein BDQ17DRAFT_1346968 [Cyathus striatus]